MKRVARGEEPAVLVPVVIVPVQIEVALRVVPVQVGEVTVAIAVHERGAAKICEAPPVSLPVEFSPGCIVFGAL